MIATRTVNIQRRSRWRFGVVGFLALGVPVGLVEVSAPAFGDPSSVSFNGTASAQTSQVVLRSSSLPLGDDSESGDGNFEYVVAMPLARATLSSSGASRASAAGPYPVNGTVATLSGTLRGSLIQQGVDPGALPEYPLLAQAEAPSTPDADASKDRLVLKAHADLAVANALAQLTASSDSGAASDASEAVATASVRSNVQGSPAMALGRTVFQGLNLGSGALTLGRVQSTAQATIDAGGRVSLSNDLTVEGLSLAGVPVSVDKDGLVVAGNRVPLSQVKDALATAGIGLEYVQPRVDPDGRGVTAGGLEVTYVVSAPDAAGQEPVTVVQTIGRARARMDGIVTIEPNPTPTTTVTPSVAPTSPVVEPSAEPRPTLLADGSAGGTTGPLPRVDLGVRAMPTSFPVAQFDLVWVYLALVLGGGLVTGCGLLFRLVRVQTKWI